MHNGAKLRHLRLLKGYSQNGIAKKIGVTQQAYSKIESGQIKIHDTRMKEILNAMQCSSEELIRIETFFISPQQKIMIHSSLV